jgi:hypothetical protein
MPVRHVDDFAEIARERELAEEESSNERFDRLAFAERALRLVRPRRMTIALCPGPVGPRARVKLEVGRAWGKNGGKNGGLVRDADPDSDTGGESFERWAMLSVPPRASKRAIALAVASLAGPHRKPYVLDVLLGDIASHEGDASHAPEGSTPPLAAEGSGASSLGPSARGNSTRE